MDISPDALHPSGDDPKQVLVRYYTNSGGLVDQIGLWLPAAVNDGLRRVRLTQLGVDPARVSERSSGSRRGAHESGVERSGDREHCAGRKEKSDSGRRGAVFPGFLLYIMAIFGSAPNLGAVAEDKMQRVYEMLLTSASSFELMMGKVLAGCGCVLDQFHLFISSADGGAGGYGDVRAGAAASAAVVLSVRDRGRRNALLLGGCDRVGVRHSAGRPAFRVPADTAHL